MAKEDFLKRQIEGIMKIYAKLLHREQKKKRNRNWKRASLWSRNRFLCRMIWKQ